MLSCHLIQPIEFTTKRVPASYPKAFNHIGDHIRATRLDRGLTMQDIAKLIGTNGSTVSHWEKKVTEPALRYWPRIIEFLGYCPYQRCQTLPEKAGRWRQLAGLDTLELAKKLGVDQRTYLKFETNQKLSPTVANVLSGKITRLLN